MREITEKVVEFCSDLKYSNLSAKGKEVIKQHFFDFIGVTARGAQDQSSKIVQHLLRDLKSQGNSILIGTNETSSPEYAALANGTASHAIELEDGHKEASLHPAVPVFPAALAAADFKQVSGIEFMTAAAVGFEVMIRLGKALNPVSHYGRGFHPTGTCGAFGATAAAAYLLGVKGDELRSAFGITGSFTAGSHEYHAEGAWTKQLHPGWAAHSGLLAALLAKRKYFGPQNIFGGKEGFLKAYSDNANPEQLIRDLGETFNFEKASIKLHACCRYKHAAIDSIIKIVTEHNLMPEQIKNINIGIISSIFPTIIEPREVKGNPSTVSVARFSMAYGAAVAVLRRRASLDEYTPEMVSSPEVKNLLPKVSFFKDPELDAKYPKLWPAIVEVETMEGQIYKEKIDYARGDPENPVDWNDLLNKFKGLTNNIFNTNQVDKIINAVSNLEEETDMKKLTCLLGSD